MEKIKIKSILIIITYTVILYMTLNNFTAVRSALDTWFGLIVPFIYGLGIAYILNIPYQFFLDKLKYLFERKKIMSSKFMKPAALILTYVSVFLTISLIVWFIIPQLGSSVNLLVKSLPTYLVSLELLINDFLSNLNLTDFLGTQTSNTWTNILQQAATMLSGVLLGIFDYIVSFTGGLYNWLIGITVSIYLLLGKDNLQNQIKRVMKAYLSEKKMDTVMDVASRSNRIFNSFIRGSITDSFVVGILCFIGMSIFGVPYALLVSVIQAITNIIPVFGPLIGAVPSTFIILMDDPLKALIFVIFIFVLQQIDGNIIQPRIVGSSIGLPGIWVLFAIVVGSGLLGIVGLIFGVPAAAVLYSLFKESVNKRLKNKENNKEAVNNDLSE